MTNRSLCQTCSMMREIVTPRGSRFLLCTLSATDKRYAKYPPQPIIRCEGYRTPTQTNAGGAGPDGGPTVDSHRADVPAGGEPRGRGPACVAASGGTAQ
jgi:hypothetical protein